MRHTTVFDTPQPLIYHICIDLKLKVCILCHITSYTTPSASFNFDQTSPRYCFQMQLQNKHSQYEAHDRLRYTPAPYIPHMYSFEAKSMHFISYNFLYDPHQSLSISTKLHQGIAFRCSFKINIDHMRHTTVFDTPQPLIYHICTALKPKVCILCHITSYTTPSASFNFDQTSTRYCFQMQLQNKHRQYETHDRLRYTPAPYIPHMYSFEAKSMHFMSYNFLYDPLSLFQFRSNFTKLLLLDVASK